MNSQEISQWFRNFTDDFTDFRIPSALSNEENKFLEENIEAKTKELSNIQLDINENRDRIQMIENHQKNIQDELEMIQRLLTACHTNETADQSHVDIDTMEIKRFQRLIINLENNLQIFLKRKHNFQIDIDQIQNEITKMTNSTEIDRDNLENFIDTIKHRDEEIFSLMKYTQEDNIRIKELTMELERYSAKSIQLKRDIEEGLIEYTGLQIELDRIAERFRRSYQHRQELLKRWETILEQMQRKDQNIDQYSIELIRIKIQGRKKEQELNEQKLFSERELNNNKILEKLIDFTNQKIIRLKAKQKINDEKQEHVETDRFSLKFVLINTQNQVQREHAFINELKSNILTKQQDLAKVKHRHEQILNRKYFIINEKYSLDEKLCKYENLIKNEETYQKNLNNQYKKLIENLLNLNNEVLSIRRKEKQYENNHQFYENQIHNLKSQLNKYDYELLKQQELIYHHEFLKQTIDRRYNKIINEKNAKQKILQSDNQIYDLKAEYERKKLQFNQLNNQIKILQEELRIIKRDFQRLNDEKTNLNDKFLQFDLYITLSEKKIKKINNEKEDYLVEENLLNIELKRIKNNLHHSNEINSNLEQQKIEIQKAIKERRMEMEANNHLFQIRFNDERTKKVTISTELAMRVTRIDKLKHRYETLSILLNNEKSDEENLLNQAQYIIKSAQMKDDLLKQGDQLESLIIKAETELRALENTVQILNWNNIDVKRNFQKLNETSSEICHMKELEEHFRAVTEQVKIRRKLLNETKTSISSHELTRSQQEIDQINLIIKNKRHARTKLEDEIKQYNIKIARADQIIKRFQQTIAIDEDIDIRLQYETQKKLEQQLVSLCSCIDDKTVINILEELSIELGYNLSINSRRHSDKFEKKSLSNMSLIPNIVNISIDSNSRSTTSESTRSKHSI